MMRLLPLIMLLAACTGQQMDDQPRADTFEASSYFADGTTARVPPAGTVAQEDRAQPRPTLNAALLARGRERFAIYCSPCHGLLGDGRGMIVQRGFPPPPSYHSDRLRQAGLDHFYRVISEGYGDMYAYADRVAAPDRWAIAVYIRALQLSRHATIDDVEPKAWAALGDGRP